MSDHEHCAHCGQPIDVEGMMHVTVDHEGVYIEAAMFGYDTVRDFANAVKPLGWMVVASPMTHDHD